MMRPAVSETGCRGIRVSRTGSGPGIRSPSARSSSSLRFSSSSIRLLSAFPADRLGDPAGERMIALEYRRIRLDRRRLEVLAVDLGHALAEQRVDQRQEA